MDLNRDQTLLLIYMMQWFTPLSQFTQSVKYDLGKLRYEKMIHSWLLGTYLGLTTKTVKHNDKALICALKAH